MPTFISAPSIHFQPLLGSASWALVVVMPLATELAKSTSEARLLITQGGAYVNNRRIDDLDARLGPDHLASQTIMVLRSGKKRYALLRFQE